jgi:low affinity Fe/Cu permease
MANGAASTPNFMERFSRSATQWAGSSWAFGIALAVILLWIASGPVFGYSDTWQLVINTSTTIVTFLMVFLIQRSQNKDAQAMHLKLNEIVATLDRRRRPLRTRTRDAPQILRAPRRPREDGGTSRVLALTRRSGRGARAQGEEVVEGGAVGFRRFDQTSEISVSRDAFLMVYFLVLADCDCNSAKASGVKDPVVQSSSVRCSVWYLSQR